jgi:quercetin dioxygenase-like cupin family protein
MTEFVPPKFMFKIKDVTTTVYHANKGEGLPKHGHFYDHSTMCVSGSCVVRKENKSLVLTKNSQPILLVAPDWHEIEALEDGTVFINVFAEGEETVTKVLKTK